MIDPELRVQEVFLQLEFAIKLMTYFELKKVDKESFDTDTTIILANGRLNYPDSSFKTYDSLILAAQNAYSSILGVSVISLEAALTNAGIPNDPFNVTPRGRLRSIVYLIRCAFAHDMMFPKWQIDSRYLKHPQFTLFGHGSTIDLKALNGKLFDLEQIGGMLVYLDIKNEILFWLREQREATSIIKNLT